MSMDTQSSLLLRVRNIEDQASWDKFAAQYQPLLLAYVQRHGLKEHDAFDVVQEIFIALIQKMPEFTLDRERGRFRTWLWKVTHNAVINWKRIQNRHAAAEESLRLRAGLESAVSQDEFEKEARASVLEAALKLIEHECLPTTWRCFREHILNGRPAADVASELNVSSGVVFAQASRVLKKLRRRCAERKQKVVHA